MTKEKLKPIVDYIVILRYFGTACFILVGIVWHQFCIAMLIVVSVFCEIYWYLWQKEKQQAISAWNKRKDEV